MVRPQPGSPAGTRLSAGAKSRGLGSKEQPRCGPAAARNARVLRQQDSLCSGRAGIYEINATSWTRAQGPGAPRERRQRSHTAQRPPAAAGSSGAALSFLDPACCRTCPDRPCSERYRISEGSKSIFCCRAIGHFGLPAGKSGRKAPAGRSREGGSGGRCASGQSLLARTTPTRREQEDFQRCSILSCRPAAASGFREALSEEAELFGGGWARAARIFSPAQAGHLAYCQQRSRRGGGSRSPPLRARRSALDGRDGRDRLGSRAGKGEICKGQI